MTTFAGRLNAAMDEASLSAAELAERSGLTESAISLLRSSQREPSYRTLTRLSAVLPALTEGLSEEGSPFDSIEDAIADIRAGKMVVVLDDE
ncbi:MAG TPA: helix-turn-helix domain-containing protein, partial [Candidatus Acidoferrales bacterium]|nr:helix-turn-helix domain-containing protein [Candidatus Acidoferrales bacterium]